VKGDKKNILLAKKVNGQGKKRKALAKAKSLARFIKRPSDYFDQGVNSLLKNFGSDIRYRNTQGLFKKSSG